MDTNKLLNQINIPYLEDFNEFVINALNMAINKFIEDKDLFSIDNFSYVFNDEYIYGTNCNKEIFSNLYLIINQPNNIKLNKITKKKSDKIKVPDLYIDLDSIKKAIFEILVNLLDSNNVLWTTESSIAIKLNFTDEFGSNFTHFFNIIPCLNYYNKDNVCGVIYNLIGDTQIEYPEKANENYQYKNDFTDDIYRQTILIFKNILLSTKDINEIPSEIIETILYNVPTEMFLNTQKSTLVSIINYLRNFSIKDYLTIDEQDNAFTSQYRSMSPFYVKHILRILEREIMQL